MHPDFTLYQLLLVAVIFVWTGFVRTGLGFGGAALSLPILLFLYDDPVYWLPIIGAHLLFFSAITLRTRINNVDWDYLKHTSFFIVPAALVGVFGLLNLPSSWLNIFIYTVTLFYAVLWMLNIAIRTNSETFDKFLLIIGGYVAGTSLAGAPLMIAVFMRNIAFHQLRNTMFVLWFVLVSIKMATFAALGVDLNLLTALALLPIAAIGHFLGLKAHDKILENSERFKQVIGAGLSLVCIAGLYQVIFSLG